MGDQHERLQIEGPTGQDGQIAAMNATVEGTRPNINSMV